MAVEYLGLSEINGPLVVLEGVQNAAYDEIVEMTVAGNTKKIGRIIEIYGDKAIIQVFEGTDGMALRNTHTRLTGHPMEIAVSEEMLGRTFNGIGEPIDGLGDIISDVRLDINGQPLNPVSREYPRNYIRTGISAIDGLTTLIRGQKLPIFSGNGLPHDQLAAQIVQQASLGEGSDESFAIVFGAMGVKHDVADFFRRTFEESGVSEHVAMFINLANDPVVERLITPKIALTLAEYLAYEKGMHILVILTDMTSYAEALREVSSSKGEIPSRKGFPGYLYSDLASLYERAGVRRTGMAYYGRSKRLRRGKWENRMAIIGITMVVISLAVAVNAKGASLKQADLDYRQKEADLARQVQDEENRTRELEEYKIYVQTKQYAEEVAKEKLGLVNPDEILLKPRQ